MVSPLQSYRHKKAKKRYVPGTRWRNILSRDRKYELEPLEPRYLLSATLHDGGDTGAPTGPPTDYSAGQASVADNIQLRITSAFDQLAKMGNILNSDPVVADTIDETALPFFQKSVGDLFELAQTDLDVGDLLIGNVDGITTAYKDAAESYFNSTTTDDTTGLTAALQLALDSNFSGGLFTVTDRSTTNLLQLDFSFDYSEFTLPLALGAEATEFYLTLEDGSDVKFDFDSFDFTLKADLTGIDRSNASPAGANYSPGVNFDLANGDLTTDEVWFEFGGTDNGTLTWSGLSQHSNAQDPITGYGIGFGLIEARPNGTTDPGGFIANTGATFDLDLQVDFNLDASFSDGSQITLAELLATDPSGWTEGTEFNVDTPTGAGINEASLFLPIEISNPSGDTFITNLDNLGGSFTLNDADIFDTRAPLVEASDPTLAAQSRMTVDDLLQMAKNAGYIFDQAGGLTEMESFLPMLDINLGQAYEFITATDRAFIDPLQTEEAILRFRNAPSSTSGDPLDFSGDSSFTLYVFVAGALVTNAAPVVLSARSRNSVQDIADDLNTELDAIFGDQHVFARVSNDQTPRLELYGNSNVSFFISDVNSGSETLDLGIDPNGMVFARNSGTITEANQSKYQLQEVKVESTSAITLSSFTTQKTFTVAIGTDSATTVTIDPQVFSSMADFALAIQSDLAEAGLYDGVSGEGVEVDIVASADGQGFGLEFSISGARSAENLTLGGADVGVFHLSATSGSPTLSPGTPVQLSPLQNGFDLTVTIGTQEGGVISSLSSETVTIPGSSYADVGALAEAIRTALQNAGLYDGLNDTGIRVSTIEFNGGDEGLRFYGTEEVYHLGVASPDFALINLGSANESVTAAYIDIDVKADGNASATTTRVYVNGNTTTDLLGQFSNSTVSDFVSDFQGALDRAGLRDFSTGTGVDIRSIEDASGNASDTIEFFALNPGSGTGFIQEISTGASASSGMGDYNLDSLSSQNMAVSTLTQSPTFDSIQDFVRILNTSVGTPIAQVEVINVGGGEGIRISAYPGQAITTIEAENNNTVKRRLEFPTDPQSGSIESADAIVLSDFTTDRTFDLDIDGTEYEITIPGAAYANVRDLAVAVQGAIRDAGFYQGLLSSNAVYNGGDLSNGVSPYYNFPIRFFVDETSAATNGLTDIDDVSLRFESTYGDVATGRVRDIQTTEVVNLSRQVDVSFTLGVDLVQPDHSGEQLVAELPINNTLFEGVLTNYDALFKIILDDGVVHDVIVTAASTAGNVDIQDFVNDINTAINAIPALTGRVVAELDSVNSFSREVIRFVTTAGASQSLTVQVPEYISEDTLLTNEAADKFGFTTQVTPTYLRDVDELFGAPDTIDASTAIPVNNPDYDIYYRITLEDVAGGSALDTYVFSTRSTDTSGNGSLANLISDINTAFRNAHGLTAANAPFEAYNNGGGLGFRISTVGLATYDNIRATIGKNVYLGAGTDPIIADNAIDLATFTTDTEAFFIFTLPDGSNASLQVEVADTADNASLQDLIDDINNAIQSTTPLMDNEVFQKVIAYETGGKLAFKLNTDNVFPSGGNWVLQVNAQYEDSDTNASNYELQMPEEVFEDTQAALIGVISSTLQPADAALSNDFSVDISINGWDYVTLTLPVGSTAGNTQISDLIADINTALAATNITDNSTPTANVYPLSDFIKAIALGGGEVIQLAVIDANPADTLDILNVRFAPTTDSNNGYLDLGFVNEESRIGIRGSDATLANILLNGRAEVRDSDFAGSAAIGITDFTFGSTDFDAITDTTLQITGTKTRMVDLMRYFGSYQAEYNAAEIDHSLTINGDTALNLELQNMAFVADSLTGDKLEYVKDGAAATDLAFGSNATFDIFYQLRSNSASSSIGAGPAADGSGTSSFDRLPVGEVLAANTNDLELLGRLSFDDISYALWRVGDFISDWLNNDPNGPFAANLFFAKTGLVDVQDFGDEFRRKMIELWVNPPENLQELQRGIETVLGLSPGDVSVQLITSGSGATFDAKLNIQFDWLTTFASTLPLYIDIAQLADRNNQTGLIKQSLLGLSSLASNPTNPMEVELQGLSKMQLDLDIEIVESGVVIEPTPILNQPGSGDFFETKFFLTGDSFTGDLPAGANRLRLGYSWFDDTGREVLAPDNGVANQQATVATIGNLSAVYNGATGTLTSTVAGDLIIDGITLTERSASGEAGDYVLVKDQADAKQNGLYEVTEQGDSGVWVLTRVADDLSWLKVEVGSGSINGGRVFMVKDVPTVDVAAAAIGSKGTTFNANNPNPTTFTGTTQLVIDSITPAAGDYIQLDGQTDEAENGVYEVISNAAGGFTLHKVEILGLTMAAVATTNISGTYTAGPASVYLPYIDAGNSLSIDGVVPADGEFVLLAGQHLGATGAPNGLYQVVINGGNFELYQFALGTGTLAQVNVTGGTARTGKTYYVDYNNITNNVRERPATEALSYNVVELRPAAVAVSEGGEVALPDVNGTPHIYDTEEITTDENDIAAADFTVRASTTTDVGGTFSAGTITLGTAAPVIDGITLADSDLVMVNHQSDGSQNGIYEVNNPGGGGNWELVRVSTYDELTDNLNVRVAVSEGSTYGGFEFKMEESVTAFDTSIIRFSKLIDPASFSLNLTNHNSTTSRQLPYTVVAATTSDILVSGDGTSSASYSLANGTITADQNGLLSSYITNAWDSGTSQVVQVIGIDGVGTNLFVGLRLLVKDIGRTVLDPSDANYDLYQGDSANGVYEIVDLGSSTTPWQLKRVDFADEAAEFDQLKVAVQVGTYNQGTRWIQTLYQPATLGSNFDFTSEIGFVYANYDSGTGNVVGSWLDFSADGNAGAVLPLSPVVVPDIGGETVLSKNLGSLTDTEKKALGQLGDQVLSDALYLASPDLDALRIFIPDDTVLADDGFTGSGLEKFFDTKDVAVDFDPLPDLFRTIPPSDVLSLLRDWVFVGDALDLAFFSIQFGLDRALGIEVPILGTGLPDYTGFIEEFRSSLTDGVRENLRISPLRPTQAVRDAIYSALGPNGLNYFTSVSDISILVDGVAWDIDTTADPNNGSHSTYYGTTPEGQLFEKSTGPNIEFTFTINKAMDTDASAVGIDTISSGDAATGLTISSAAVVQNGTAQTRTTGGVQLKRSFEFNFGFGMDILDGFYVFNPTQTSPTAAPGSDFVKIGVEAQLDGDIYTEGVQQFSQPLDVVGNDAASQLHQITLGLIDGRIDYSTDGKASGYFGTYEFNLNTNDLFLPLGFSHERVGRNNIGVTVDQFRVNETLAPEYDPSGLMNFVINSDADIHLLAESARDSLIPAYEFDIFISKRWGSGYAGLTFDANLAGLSSAASEAAFNQKIFDAATGVTSEGDANYPSESDIQVASPFWRVDRSQLTAVSEGQTFIAFQNINIDVKDFLGGPLYDALIGYNKGLEKIRPFIDFMTTPIPGTEWMAQPFVPGDFLGPVFQIFIATINTMDKLLGSVARYAELNQRTYNRPRVSMGGTYAGFTFERRTGLFDSGNEERLNRYKEARQQRVYDKETQQLFDNMDSDVWQRNPLYEGDPNRDAALATLNDIGERESQSLLNQLRQKSQEPNKFSEGFEKWRDGDVGWLKQNESPSGFKDKAKNTFKKSVTDALAYNDDRGGRKDLDAGITGGGFQLDALSVETAQKIFLGQTADLLRVEIPKVYAGFAYTRFFPLPAFPPLGVTLGFKFNVFIHLSFGYDTQGFFWTDRDSTGTTLDTSNRIATFGFSIRFSVGVELNLGLIAAGVEAFLEVGVEFFWNTPENASKLRQREITWLFDNGRSLFDIRVYGKVGVEIYVDLTIPIPFVGPIVKRIFSKVFEIFLFDELIDLPSGVIQLAEKSGNSLRLNMGAYASERIFNDIRNLNENFQVFHVGGNSSAGEDVVVAFYGVDRTYYSKYTGIKHVYGYTGNGATRIDAGNTVSGVNIDFEEGGSFSGNLEPLKYATVNFFAGTGSTYLRTAGASTWGNSRLDARNSSGVLDATSATKGVTLIAGTGNAEILGSNYADNIVSNSGSDILRGYGGGIPSISCRTSVVTGSM
jgi:hypothetical protein